MECKFKSAKDILNLFKDVRETSINSDGFQQYQALCPYHDDSRASLSLIDNTEISKITFKCFAECNPKDIFNALGISSDDTYYEYKIQKEYEYRDENGDLKYKVQRYNNKSFPKSPAGEKSILYNLPELVKIENSKKPIFIVEGEKDADSLIELGFLATTSTNGANGFKEYFQKYFIGRDVIIIRDKDELKSIVKQDKNGDSKLINYNPGLKFENKIKKILSPVVTTLKCGTVPDGKDISDYIKILKVKNINIENIIKLIWDLTNAWQDSKINLEFFTSKGQLIHEKLSKFLIEKHKLIKIGDVIYAYINDDYRMLNNEGLQKLIRTEIRSLRIKQVAETIADIKSFVDIVEKESDPRYIKVKNGIFDIETDQLLENSSNFIITNTIPWEYNPNSYDEMLDSSLDEWSAFDSKTREMFEEMFGYSIYRSSKFKKYFIIHGESDTGKSTFLELFNILVGDENSTCLSLQQFTEDYYPVDLISKLVNVGDDISSITIKNSAILKTLTSGEVLKVRQIRQDTVTLKNYATLLFSCNHIPRIVDVGGGHDTRHVIIPFKPVFIKINRDLRKRLSEKTSMEYLLKLAINGLKRLLKNGKFTISEASEIATKEYSEENNPILEFLEYIGGENSILNRQSIDVYQEYKAHMSRLGALVYGHKIFTSEIKRFCKMKHEPAWSNGKKIRIFKKGS